MSISTEPPQLLIVDPNGVTRSRTAGKSFAELVFPTSIADTLAQGRLLVAAHQPAVILLVLDKAARDPAAWCTSLCGINTQHPPALVIISEKTPVDAALVVGNGINAVFAPPYSWSAITGHLRELLDNTWERRKTAALDQLLELGRIAVLSIDAAQLCHISKAAATLLNLATSEREIKQWDASIGHDWRSLFSRCEARDQQRITDVISDAIDAGSGFELELELAVDRHHKRRLRITGHVSHMHGAAIRITDLLLQDVTPQSARTNSDAVNRLMDTTLGLRRGDRVLQSLLQVITEVQRGSVLLIHLQGIANFHRRHGYEQSGRLLRQFAETFETQLRKLPSVHRFNSNQQVLARLAGGEFIVIFPNAADDAELALLLNQSLSFATRSLQTHDELALIGLRFGIASWPRDGTSPDEILQAGSLASHYFAAVDAKPDTVPTMNTLVRAREQARLEMELQYAIERGQLQLHYQPKLGLSDGVLNGFEALLRWQRGKSLFIPPAIFIPIAERTGLISTLGTWVIETAAAQIAEWRRAGAGNVPVAINVSPQQFVNGDITGILKQVCRQQMIEPHFLQIEITESCLIDDAESATQQLLAIRELGHQIALDDFGTGYSSLSYLRQLPLDILKIDRSFITPIDPAAGSRNLAFNIIGLGRSLGLKIVAEGVSSATHWDALKQWKCDEAQGYLISQPVNAAEAISLWKQGQWDERSHTFKMPNYAARS
jgi:EAL domain-containing protein (putative c-di-GMP-specific phosphodiesterase class I)/GGDEF domain-containing protein